MKKQFKPVLISLARTKAVIYFVLPFFILFCMPIRISAQIKYGFIKVECDVPGKNIFLDGGLVGVTPITEPIEVPIGTHQVSFFETARAKEKADTIKKMALIDYAQAPKGGFAGGVARGMAIGTARSSSAEIDAGTLSVYVPANKIVTAPLSWAAVESIRKKRQDAWVTFWVIWAMLVAICLIGLSATSK